MAKRKQVEQPAWRKRATNGRWKQVVCVRLPTEIIDKVNAAGGMHVVIDRGLGKGAK